MLIQQILTTAGILDAAATLMKRPSSSEQVRGGICYCPRGLSVCVLQVLQGH